MKIKIIKAKNDSLWYKPSIGETFTVGLSINESYYQLEGDGDYILKEDAEIVEEKKSCDTCLYRDIYCLKRKECNNLESWKPLNAQWVETADASKIVSGREQQNKIAGVGTKTKIKDKCIQCKYYMVNSMSGQPCDGCEGNDRFVKKHEESPTITAFRQIMDDKIKLAITKNNDYGNSVDKILDDLADSGHDPYVSLYVRLADKFYRFENLAIKKSKQQVKDESIMDTLADLSNYVDLFRGWKMRRDADNGQV